jgi:hypothetical protein
MAEGNQSTGTGDGAQSTIVRAAVAAAATGAAAYGVKRLRASQHGRGDSGEEHEPGARDNGAQSDENGSSGKRGELTQTLTSKASEVKKAATKLKPGGSKSSVESAWETASPYVLRFANEAAAFLGSTVGEKAPDLVRDELMPHFIEGFEQAR